MSFKKLFFATAGIPLSTAKPSTINGIGRVNELGLGGMELEFVHSINVSKDNAPEVKKVASEKNVFLTCHGSYYINLNALERPKYHASVSRAVACAKRAEECGAVSMTFHAGFYLGLGKEKTFENIKKGFEEIESTLKNSNYKMTIRPETTGKESQFGSLEELLTLSSQLNNTLPCIDFSHLHARSNGKYNSYEEFRKVLEDSERVLGKSFLKNLHCHVSGIEYTNKGERKHLFLKDSDLKYKELLMALKEMDCRGIIVCESPNIEDDALLLKKTFEEI
ncbi:MAG: TIM barrel protein [Candidatus Iainarchaeum sp.]